MSLATLLALLAACGGGGGSAGSPAVPGGPPPALPAVDTSAVAAQDPGSPLPEGWMHGGLMQVYVRAYQDSDGDGIGDLRGLIQRLDYLKDLGVAGLWLMPVARSQDRDHGYAVTDYRDIEADYGTLADFDELLRQAHSRGLGVIVDHVMNHSAASHPAFVNARAGAGNAFRDWYVWAPARPAGWSIYGGDPWRADATGWYFAPFWDQMPDFNLRNGAVVAWHHDHLRLWLNRGVDGFRFDAVGNLVENGPTAWESQPESLALMGEVRRTLATYQRRFMVCEAPAAPLAFAAASACGSAFAFGHQSDLLAAAAGSVAALARVAAFPGTVPATMATFLSNHDSFAGQRVGDQLGGSAARAKLAAALLLLQPGVPFIYYGEEIGMAGAATLTGDPRLRTPMSWTGEAGRAGFTTGAPFRALAANAATHNVAAQAADPDSLLAFYKGMLALRGNRPSIARGDYATGGASGAMLAFTRTLGAEQTLVAVNVGTTAGNLLVGGLAPGATYAALWPRQDASHVTADGSGRATIGLAALGVHVFERLP